MKSAYQILSTLTQQKNTLKQRLLSRTNNLSLGRYLRNVHSVGWNLCLVRQHGLATAICEKTFISYVLQKSLSVFWWPMHLGLLLFIDFLHTSTDTNLRHLASLFLLVAPLPHISSLKLTVLDCSCSL